MIAIFLLSFVGNFHYATCDGLLSMLNPIKYAFKLLKYVLAFAKAINSVVHTGVKSPWM